MTLDDILFAQYQLGREHEAMVQRGEKRKVGGEITEAKKQIQKLLEKEYVRGINSASDMVTELEKKITENRPPDIIDLMQSTQRLFGGEGAAVLKDINGKLLGHCSCYGPLEERNPKCIYSLEEIVKLLDKHCKDTYGGYAKAVAEKLKELEG